MTSTMSMRVLISSIVSRLIKRKVKQVNFTTSKIGIQQATHALPVRQKNNVKKVFVLGTNSFKKSILDAGIDLCSHTPEFVVVGYARLFLYMCG